MLLSGLSLVLGKVMGQHRVHVHTRFKVGFYPRDTRIVKPYTMSMSMHMYMYMHMYNMYMHMYMCMYPLQRTAV